MELLMLTNGRNDTYVVFGIQDSIWESKIPPNLSLV